MSIEAESIIYSKVEDSNGVTLGFAMGSFDPNTGSAFLDTIHVVNGERRRGIGTRVLTHFKQEALNLGAISMTGKLVPEAGFVTPEEVKSFYIRNGVSVSPEGMLFCELKNSPQTNLSICK